VSGAALPLTDVVAELAERFGPGAARSLAERLARGDPQQALLAAVASPGFADAAAAVLTTCREQDWDDATAGAYLRGVADGFEHRAARVQVETVWSGPNTPAVPVRASPQVLIDLIAQARTELLLMTYSARPHPPVTGALQAASARGVQIDVVVETLAGAGGALAGSEPATAFLDIPGVRLWHWPPVTRTEPGAKMHAKVAVADRSVLLVTSANLTQSGADRNIESGLLVRGGHAPARAVEHVARLQADGVLVRLTTAAQAARGS
jgi:phosphatidylserine/phosphatidylglycerophosphate/cardiolipin synthase-like enzyme